MNIEGVISLPAASGLDAAGPDVVKPRSKTRPTLMKMLSVAVAGAAFLTFGTAEMSSAAVMTFADRGAFDAAASGLAFEDFEEANVLDESFELIPSPLNSTTNNAVFSAGDIEAGIQFTNNPSDNTNGLAVTGDGFGQATGKKLFPAHVAEALDIEFTEAVNAVGLDVVSIFNTSDVVISVFGADGLLEATIVPGSTVDTFFGIISDTYLITKITISDAVDAAAGVDNIAFGLAGQADDVSEPAGLAILGLGLGLLGFAGRRAARR